MFRKRTEWKSLTSESSQQCLPPLPLGKKNAEMFIKFRMMAVIPKDLTHLLFT